MGKNCAKKFCGNTLDTGFLRVFGPVVPYSSLVFPTKKLRRKPQLHWSYFQKSVVWLKKGKISNQIYIDMKNQNDSPKEDSNEGKHVQFK